MKRLLSLVTLLSLVLTHSSALLFAQAAGTLNDFEISAPTEVFINEAFDVTVKAVDVTGKKIDTYEGTIFFDANTNIADVEMPFKEGEYTFTLSDQGQHTFQKGFTLKKAGKHELVIFELEGPNSGIEKIVTVTAIDKGATTPGKTDITIKEPTTDTTVSTKTVTVSGVTKATSSVNIKLNGTKVKTTQSDTTGKFSAEVGDLKAGSNLIVAEVLDGTSAVIGTSAPVTIKFDTVVPKLTSLTIKEGDEFFAGSSITFVGVGDESLKKVEIKVGDKSVILDEDKSKLGTYTGVFLTSEFEGEFKASALLETQLGVKAEQKDMVKYRTVTAKFENIKIETTTDKKVKFTFEVEPDLDQIRYFKIKYGTESGKYTKDVTTYEKIEIKEGTTYTWYIPGLPAGEYFSTIIALDKDKKDTPVTSDEQTFTIALDAAPTCFIDKVSGIRVDRTAETYSTITWDKLSEAVAYQVFKKDSSGEFALIDEITTNSYRVNIDMSASEVTYDDFKVRGICKNGTYTGQGDYSDAVAVPTGPVMIIFLSLFLASGIALILMRRGYFN